MRAEESACAGRCMCVCVWGVCGRVCVTGFWVNSVRGLVA